MANEITVGYRTGATLTYGVYDPDGTVQTAAGTALTEVAGTGYYKATDANIAAGDIVIVKEGTVVVAYGEYLPQVTSDVISSSLTTIDTNVDTLITGQNKVTNVWPLPPNDLVVRSL